MNEELADSTNNVLELARLVDCLDETGFAALAGVKLSTVDAWRRRGKGPAYVLLGRNYLYPIEEVRHYISGLTKPRTAFSARDCVL